VVTGIVLEVTLTLFARGLGGDFDCKISFLFFFVHCHIDSNHPSLVYPCYWREHKKSAKNISKYKVLVRQIDKLLLL
jgi:hypothetical protein